MNKKYGVIALMPFFILCITKSFGQYYSWTGKCFKDSTITIEEPHKYYYKGYEDHIRVYIRLSADSKCSLIIKDINLHTLTCEKTDSICDDTCNFFYHDFIPTTNYDIIIGNNRLYIHDRQTQKNFFVDNNRAASLNNTTQCYYNKGYLVNDSVACLYNIYSYHPFDGFPGLHLNLYNLHQKKFIKDTEYVFPGVALSPMINKWAYANDRNIFVVTPLTGILYKYNFELKLIDSIRIPIKWLSYEKNVAYQNHMDTLVYKDWDILHNVYMKYGHDSGLKRPELINSKVQTKDFISDVINNTRSNYEYIEKLVPYNDSIIIITMSKPGYALNYRDLLFYNINTNSIITEKIKWSCSGQDTLTKFEDFFSIGISNSEPNTPYFYGKQIFSPTPYNPLLYKNGSADSLKRNIFHDELKNKYQWYLLEYQLL